MRSLERLKLIAYTKKDFKLVAVESSRKPNFLTNKLKSTMYTNLNLRHSFVNSIHNITTKLNSNHFMMNKQHKVAKILSFFINFLVHLFTLKFFFCVFLMTYWALNALAYNAFDTIASSWRIHLHRIRQSNYWYKTVWFCVWYTFTFEFCC